MANEYRTALQYLILKKIRLRYGVKCKSPLVNNKQRCHQTPLTNNAKVIQRNNKLRLLENI